MSVTTPPLIAPPRPRKAVRPDAVVRVVIVTMLLCLIVAGSIFLFGTEEGRQLIDEESRHKIGLAVRDWVAEHPMWAPLTLIGAYIACSLLALPVWWVQILAGYGFGMVMGVVWCQGGAVVGACVTLAVSHWLGASWFQEKIESRMHRIRSLDEKLGHNGLLVVLMMRLLPLLPFGLSNYALGLTRVRLWHVAAGTWLGIAPIVTFYVAIGAKPWLLKTRWFWAIWVAAHFAVLVPVLVKYIRPVRNRKAVAAPSSA